MSNGKATASFFENGSTTQFEYCYKLYPEVLKMKAEKKSKKPQELIRLDQWFQNELPGLIKARGKDAHLVYDELVQAMKWKQSRGKFYPQLSYLVKVNTPRAVIQETKKAFRKLPNLEQAITALSNLKGVGTTMASALLTAAAPDSAPFMADECLMAIPEIEGIDYTTKEYLNFVQHIQATVERLNAEVGGETPHWSPHRVELALWSHYVANDLSPELLDDMPPPGVAVANNASANTNTNTNGSLTLSLQNSSKNKILDGDDTNDGVAVDVDDESLGAGGRNTATESETENENTNPIALLPLNSALAKMNSSNNSNINSNNNNNNNNNTAALQDGDSNFVSNDSTSQEEPIIDDNTTQTTATTTSTEDGEPIGGVSDSESNLEAPAHNNNKLNNNGQKPAGAVGIAAAGGVTGAVAGATGTTTTTGTAAVAAVAANGNGNAAGNGVLTLETAASASLPAHLDDEHDDEDEDEDVEDDEDEEDDDDEDDDEDVDDELEADGSNSSSNLRTNNKLQQLQTVVAATAPSIGQKRTALHCDMEAAANATSAAIGTVAAAADKSSPELKKLRSD